MASVQMACFALSGLTVKWEGVVRQVRTSMSLNINDLQWNHCNILSKQVSVESRYNMVESLLQWLPSKWSEWLKCRIGEKWPPCHNHDHGLPQSLDSRRCHLFWRLNHDRGSLCHVDRFSKFILRLEVRT